MLYLSSNIRRKCLDTSTTIVVGKPGTGKTSLFSFLTSNNKDVGAIVPSLKNIIIAGVSVDQYCEFFVKYVDQGNDAYDVWLALAIRAIANAYCYQVPSKIEELVYWVKQNPIEASNLVKKTSNKVLLAFDAVECLGATKAVKAKIFKGLEHLIACLKQNGIYCKVFVEKGTAKQLTTIPDNEKTELVWSVFDLHACFWNALLAESEDAHHIIPHEKFESLLQVAEEVQTNEITQKRLFDHFFPNEDNFYAHLTNTIAADNVLTPGAFVNALKGVANSKQHHYMQVLTDFLEQAAALHLNEISKHYPWIEKVLNAFRGLKTPCTIEEAVTYLDKTLYQIHNLNDDNIACWHDVIEIMQDLVIIRKRARYFDFHNLWRVGFLDAPRTDLGRRLRKIKQLYIEAGGKTFALHEFDAEVQRYRFY